MVPFAPRGMTAEEVKQRCIEARQPVLQPAVDLQAQPGLQVNGRGWFMWSHFYSINLLFRSEVMQSGNFPWATRRIRAADQSRTQPGIRREPTGGSVLTMGSSHRPRHSGRRCAHPWTAAPRADAGADRHVLRARARFFDRLRRHRRERRRYSWLAISTPASWRALPAGRSARCM